MKLTIIGTGIKGVEQVSLEGVAALAKSKKVCYLPVSSSELEKLLEKLGVTCFENLMPLYQDGENDETNYTRIFNRVLADCQTYGDVSLLIPGDPRVGVTLVQWFESRKDMLGIQVEVISGISSFATMTNDLKRDPLERGSVVLDANRLLLFNHQMECWLDYYIYHVCSVGTSRVHLRDATKENRLSDLKTHLLKFYPANTKLKLIGSASEKSAIAQITEETLANMENLLPHIHFGTTLFIAGANPKSINRAYLAKLRATA